jgi:hypothetical protein
VTDGVTHGVSHTTPSHPIPSHAERRQGEGSGEGATGECGSASALGGVRRSRGRPPRPRTPLPAGGGGEC